MFSKAPAVYPDPAHPTAEERFLTIGSSGDGHFLFVAFTRRTGGSDTPDQRSVHAPQGDRTL
jgi:uncharacterized DUF497 family protein